MKWRAWVGACPALCQGQGGVDFPVRVWHLRSVGGAEGSWPAVVAWPRLTTAGSDSPYGPLQEQDLYTMYSLFERPSRGRRVVGEVTDQLSECDAWLDYTEISAKPLLLHSQGLSQS